MWAEKPDMKNLRQLLLARLADVSCLALTFELCSSLGRFSHVAMASPKV